MAIEPKPGVVVYYDFLWKEESELGRQQGQKDRPCAIVLASEPREDGGRTILLCPITHAPIGEGETGLPMPPRVAQHLGLDDQPHFIKTHQINSLNWPERGLPYGLVPNKQGEWTCGEIPNALGQAIFEQIQENASNRQLQKVDRD